MLGILCGLESEAKIARRIGGARVACAASRPHKARELARELAAQGATRLMSFGIAGALHESVGLGDVLIGTEVISSQGKWACDAVWSASLAAQMPQAKRGGVYGSETLVPTGQEKQALYQETGCLIVDMESQCAAEAAAEAGLPFMVVRAVCDDARMSVPPVVMAAIADDGSIAIGRALSHIVRQPSQLVDLFHVARGTNKALVALGKAKTFI
ncbi:MAG: hypothetical protein KGI97_05360 [Alphaproteobacteria bacterium]|nr:hypothetical protein [Alphaproteobacteria bacterium]